MVDKNKKYKREDKLINWLKLKCKIKLSNDENDN
jgi:hypothetical protein